MCTWRLNFLEVEEIEKSLKDMLHEMLRDYNQEGGLVSLEYDEVNMQCTVKMNVHIVEDDEYIGFGGY